MPTKKAATASKKTALPKSAPKPKKPAPTPAESIYAALDDLRAVYKRDGNMAKVREADHVRNNVRALLA